MAVVKVGSDPRLPQVNDPALQPLTTRLYELFRGHAAAINAQRNDGTAAPTSGTWARGDFVWNSTPSEAGTAGSKYVVLGWICTAGGTPGTWLAARTLTGN